MSEPDAAQFDQWHRRFGQQLFNGTWDLIDQEERSEEEDLQMLLSAATSRWHWGQVGGPEQTTVGDWQIAHVACLLGLGDLALRFAARSLAVVEAEGWDGWQLASAHEGMARACAVAGDAVGRARHVAAAQAALEREPEAEERQVITEQLATIPEL